MRHLILSLVTGTWLLVGCAAVPPAAPEQPAAPAPAESPKFEPAPAPAARVAPSAPRGIDRTMTQLARYSVAVAAPAADAGNPLNVVATVSFPRAQVQTVGEAITHLLARTGYSLLPAAGLSDPARQLLAMPLPESHRRLGPYRVADMLRTLLGDSWALSVDHVGRTVAFQVQAAAGEAVAATR